MEREYTCTDAFCTNKAASFFKIPDLMNSGSYLISARCEEHYLLLERVSTEDLDIMDIIDEPSYIRKIRGFNKNVID